jgi:branched-subunit amino acid aminotransferase/4-amino-4-deoxychorismate lyase
MTKRKNIPLEDWITPTQAADLLGITQRHVLNLCKRDELECRRIVDRWLVSPQSVADWTPKRKRRKDKPIE